MTPSPPKPWELAKSAAATSPTANHAMASQASDEKPLASATETAPPARPSSALPLSNANTLVPASSPLYNRPSLVASPYGSPMMNSSPYYNRSFGSSYNSYGGTYGQGYGGYGQGYGGYGQGYGSYAQGYGSYGNTFGQGMVPPNGMMQPDGAAAATFQVLEQIVHAFGGLAQMLESTYFATHSSFMAMLGLAAHFSHLRGYLGEALGLDRFRIKPQRKDGTDTVAQTMLTEFQHVHVSQLKSFSKRPLFLFLVLVFGFPYLLHRLTLMLRARQSLPAPRADTVEGGTAAGFESTVQLNQMDLDETLQQQPPSATDIRFARALYDFQAQRPQEISFKKGDLIGILHMDLQSEWWRGKIRYGPIGYFPSNYVKLMDPTILPGSPSSSTSTAAASSPMDQ